MSIETAVYELPLADLVLWGKNPRKRPEENDILQLAESIRRHGVIVPITVRAHGKKWQVLDGQRRTMAARKEQNVTIPVRVVDVTDAEAMEIGLVTALESERLSVLEQSDAMQRWVDETGESHARLATRLSRSIEWVERRIFLQNLLPDMRKILNRHPELDGHMFLVARLTEDDQASLEPSLHKSIRGFRAEVENCERRLDGAPWNVADDSLPGGACNACELRTSCHPLLPGMGVDGEDLCKSRECWDSNWDRYLEMLSKEIVAEHDEETFVELPDGLSGGVFLGFQEEYSGLYGLWTSGSSRGRHGWMKRPKEIALHGGEVDEALTMMARRVGSPLRGAGAVVVATGLWRVCSEEDRFRMRRLFPDMEEDLDENIIVPEDLLHRWILTIVVSMNHPLWDDDGPVGFMVYARNKMGL